jgi:hypothetical protein
VGEYLVAGWNPSRVTLVQVYKSDDTVVVILSVERGTSNVERSTFSAGRVWYPVVPGPAYSSNYLWETGSCQNQAAGGGINVATDADHVSSHSVR